MGLGSREGADLGLSTSLKAIEVEGVYRSLFDNLDDGFELLEIVRDAENRPSDVRTLAVNQAYERLTGEGPDHLVDRRWSDLAVEPAWFERVFRVAESGRAERHEDHIKDRFFESSYFKVAEDRVGVFLRDITERKRGEEALRESEEKYRNIFNRLKEGVGVLKVLFDQEGKPYDYVILEVNAAFEAQSGLRAEDVIGKRVKEIIPTMEPIWIESYGEVVRTQQATSFERYSSTVDRWFRESASPLPQKGTLVGTFEDITERKRAEEALKIERKRLFDVLESLPVMICLITRDYHIEFANRAFKDKFGEANGRHCYECCSGFSEPCPFCESLRPFETGKPHHWEYDNGHAVIDVHVFPFTDVDGTQKVLEMDIDVTERKLAQRRAEEQRNRLKATLDAAPVGVFIADATGRVVEMNEHAKRIWGMSASLADKLDISKGYRAWFADSGARVGPDDWALTKAIRTGKLVTDLVLNIERFDGGRATVLNSAAPVRDGEGRITGGVAIVQDITELKKAEDKLKRSNAELQQFAYVASHDLQEPLRMVTSYIGLLNKKFGDQLDPKAKEYMSYAAEGSHRMRELIDDLLAYSRIDSQSTVLEEIDMNDKVRAVIEDLHVAIGEIGAEVVVNPLLRICGDRTQMKQLMTNLISNAIKFHRDDEVPRIEISAVTFDDKFVFSVRDNGIGIDPKYQEKLFKMFSRLHTREEYPGTGIGLAISKKIVERHGGKIWFESEPGKGTTFYFTVPSKVRDEA